MEKVWVYLSSKKLEGQQLSDIIALGNSFVNSWKAHDNKLSASFEVLHNYFIVVKVDETTYNASGCSIDKLLRFIKELEQNFSIQLLNRLLVAYELDHKIFVVHSSEIKELMNKGVINENTIIFDTSVADAVEFATWKKPLKNSWLKKYFLPA